MCPKYSLYLIWTNLSNVNNFWSRLPISLSKVTLGIYTSMPIILWGIKYTKMLLKYNNCTLNTVCIWFLPMFQILIQTSVFTFHGDYWRSRPIFLGHFQDSSNITWKGLKSDNYEKHWYIPHICHRHHRCNFFLSGLEFPWLNVKIVYTPYKCSRQCIHFMV